MQCQVFAAITARTELVLIRRYHRKPEAAETYFADATFGPQQAPLIHYGTGIPVGFAMDNWLERLKAFKFLENDATALLQLVLSVVLALANRILGASLLAALFVAVVFFRTLPRMKSWKGLGVEVQWFQEVTESFQASKTGTAELRSELQRITEEIGVLREQRDLPALQQLSNSASLANQKLTIVESANTDLDMLLSKGPITWVHEGSTITIYKKGEPIIKVGGDPSDEHS